jgi:hypothetical protein
VDIDRKCGNQMKKVRNQISVGKCFDENRGVKKDKNGGWK